MSVGVVYNIDLKNNATEALVSINKGLDSIGSSIKDTQSWLDKVNKSFGKVGEAFRNMEYLNTGLTTLSDSLHSAIEPGVALNSSLADFRALTGSTAEEVAKISDYARASAKAFGVDAASGVEAYKNILGELGPQLAKDQENLRKMGESVAILSKSLAGDQLQATQALTTAINQYGIDTNNAALTQQKMADFMNVMVSAAKEGSVEVPQIAEALKQSGSVAKEAGVSFEELNAAIQVVGETGRKGAEGGVAVRNFLSELGRGRFQVKEVKDKLAAPKAVR